MMNRSTPAETTTDPSGQEADGASTRIERFDEPEGLSLPRTEVDFFQTLRRIEALARDLPRIGRAKHPRLEPVRIEQTPATDFAPSTINELTTDADGRIRVAQRFLGLLGPGGPLPLETTEQVKHRGEHDDDRSTEAFLNVFHHRLATLFYRAWADGRGAVQRDRPDEDRYAAFIGALSGAGGSIASGPAGDADLARRHFTGRFASLRRNAEGLTAILESTFGCDAEVRPFSLRWLVLHRADRTCLGDGDPARGRSGRLGQSTVLGRRVRDRQSMVEVRLGPLHSGAFTRLAPGGSDHASLNELIRQYIGPGLDADVRLILRESDAPRATLGGVGRLGVDAWMAKSGGTAAGCVEEPVAVNDCHFRIPC